MEFSENDFSFLMNNKNFQVAYEKLALEQLRGTIDGSESTKRHIEFLEAYENTFGAVFFNEYRESEYNNPMRKYMRLAFEYFDSQGVTDMNNLTPAHVQGLIKKLRSIQHGRWWNSLAVWKHGRNIEAKLLELANYDEDNLLAIFKASGHLQASLYAAKYKRGERLTQTEVDKLKKYPSLFAAVHYSAAKNELRSAANNPVSRVKAEIDVRSQEKELQYIESVTNVKDMGGWGAVLFTDLTEEKLNAFIEKQREEDNDITNEKLQEKVVGKIKEMFARYFLIADAGLNDVRYFYRKMNNVRLAKKLSK